MRRYSDPIEVRSERRVVVGPDGLVDSLGGVHLQPQAFIWRARLYVVRHVLAHWSTRRAWWRDALDPAPGQPTGIAAASSERHVWRVEASPGQAFAVGVFDLEHDPGGHDLAGHHSAGHHSAGPGPPGPPDAGEPSWRLVRVAD